MSESSEQQAVVEWFQWQFKQHNIIAIPNGTWLAGDARLRAIKMKKYKDEGLTPGVSDLLICVPVGRFSGLFLEMKNVKKTFCSVSPEQRIWIEKMIKAGYMATWAAGQDRAKDIIVNYMNGFY